MSDVGFENRYPVLVDPQVAKNKNGGEKGKNESREAPRLIFNSDKAATKMLKRPNKVLISLIVSEFGNVSAVQPIWSIL